LLRESVEVLLEATPKGIDPADVREALVEIDGVSGVHDLHVWTVTSGLIAMSGHIEVNWGRDWHELLPELTHLLREEFGIAHVTLQPEEPHAGSGHFDGCCLDTPAGRAACRVAANGHLLHALRDLRH
jgi:cobalt-zinc-cadmium efflux system protein